MYKWNIWPDDGTAERNRGSEDHYVSPYGRPYHTDNLSSVFSLALLSADSPANQTETRAAFIKSI